jgi:hypoxanthine phosphoribosyltransferase
MRPEDVLRSARRVMSARDVEAAIEAMARQISADLSQRHPIVVAVMNGGVFTAVSLCRYFSFPYEFDYLHATRYGQSTSGGALQWRVRPSSAWSGRAVLLVDDVLDKGETLAALHAELAQVGVSETFTAVLVTKRVPDRPQRPRVDYSAVETDDVYLFGCGMDYAGHWRGLSELYASEKA